MLAVTPPFTLPVARHPSQPVSSCTSQKKCPPQKPPVAQDATQLATRCTCRCEPSVAARCTPSVAIRPSQPVASCKPTVARITKPTVVPSRCHDARRNHTRLLWRPVVIHSHCWESIRQCHHHDHRDPHTPPPKNPLQRGQGQGEAPHHGGNHHHQGRLQNRPRIKFCAAVRHQVLRPVHHQGHGGGQTPPENH